MQRRDFKDTSGAKPGSFFPLTEVWAPVQAEVSVYDIFVNIHPLFTGPNADSRLRY